MAFIFSFFPFNISFTRELTIQIGIRYTGADVVGIGKTNTAVTLIYKVKSYGRRGSFNGEIFCSLLGSNLGTWEINKIVELVESGCEMCGK